MAITKMDIVAFLLEALKKQGLSFLILGAVVFYFYSELRELKSEVRACNDTIIGIYNVHTAEMKEVIIRNTQAFERIEKLIDKS